jgi:Cu+-exporting ATPase
MKTGNYTQYKTTSAVCYHCGESCKAEIVDFDAKHFCCDGCKLVYELLKENSLCTYYNLNNAPGNSPGVSAYSGKYSYLDDTKVAEKLVRYSDENFTHITFYIPKIHCSSCIWLLENLNRLNEGVISSSVNFLRKETTVQFNSKKIKLSEVAELLARIDYEPLINLDALEQKAPAKSNREQVIKIGLAGFCFGNSMMLSFPEYFSVGDFKGQENLSYFFGYLNLLLALPVFFYSASGFFVSAWKSIRYRYLNIDAPIALAILVTFTRSVYEIISHTGSGYIDSMTGIVFFMLIGRYFQNKTYETLSFERDYKSYFPVGVTIKENGKEVSKPVSELKKGDHIIIRNSELIPSDAILLSNHTHIDYSFITGESAAVKKRAGELIYAGGKQLDGAIELKVQNPVSQSYLTQLWNQDKKTTTEKDTTYVDKINKYFTIAVLSIAFLSAVYWLPTDSSKALNALTAVLIVACPCGLLLTTTFANGNILRIMGRNKFYLKNAGVIEKLSQIDTIIFDKTGTITYGSQVEFKGKPLAEKELQLVASLAAQSSHPLSRKLYTEYAKDKIYEVSEFREIPGNGIKGKVNGNYLVLGSAYFVTGTVKAEDTKSAKVYCMLNGELMGYFSFQNAYRPGLEKLVNTLSEKFKLKLLSGDNDSEKIHLQTMFGESTDLFFEQKPKDKMHYVQQLQKNGHRVMMVGDGLNDAGALNQSDVGIAVSDNTNNFSPACDAILDGSSLSKLPAFIQFAKSGKKAIITTFVISLVYNIIGLSFAVQGTLSPVVAAILMPASSISIVLLTTALTSITAKFLRLN